MKAALIIFVRNPVLGKVKTRIAKDLGNEKALSIYKKLLQHTRAIAGILKEDIFVYYADHINDDDIWNGAAVSKQVQTGNDLGERMKNAFSDLFGKSYSRVIIIGSDCFELSGDLVEEAFKSLIDHNLVIGPSVDGGYYLLGMNTFVPILFDDKQWSTDTVCMDTLRDIEKTDYSLYTLPLLNDVDTADDCNMYPELLG